MNEKVKVTALPERIRYAADNKNYACTDPNCKAHHDADYVRADLLTTVRQEAREAAFRDAATLCREQESPEYDIEVMASGWEDCKLHCAETLEAAANSVPKDEGEGVEDDEYR